MESEIQSFRILSKQRGLSHEYAAAHFILDVLFTIRYSTIQFWLEGMKGEVYEEISFQTVTGDPDLDPCDRCSEYPGTAAFGEAFGREPEMSGRNGRQDPGRDGKKRNSRKDHSFRREGTHCLY